MKAFESFVESDAFFPVLIVLLIALIGVFVWIILSNKKAEKERKLRKQNIKVDESAEIKIIEDGTVPKQEKVSIEPVGIDYVEEETTNEVKIIEETIEPSPEISKVEEVDISELPLVDIPIPEVSDETFNIPKIEEKEDVGEMVEVTNPGILNEDNVPTSENVTIEFTKPINPSEDIGEKVEVPPMKELVDVGEPVVIIPESEISEDHTNEAFGSTPNESREINEDIVVENPQEYMGEKTEIFDFPDFDELSLEDMASSEDVDVESEIIKAANKYIESIMNKN